jgi:hypothetical protein
MVAAPGGPLGTVETYEYAPDNRRVVQRTGTGGATVTLWMGSERAETADTDLHPVRRAAVQSTTGR